MSRVVVARTDYSDLAQRLDRSDYRRLLRAGFAELLGNADWHSKLKALLSGRTVGMKTNCLTGQLNSTPVALVEALGDELVHAGYDENDLVVWERTSRELSRAGFTLNAASTGRRCLGTDSNGVGYSSDFHSSGNVNSLVSRVLTNTVDCNINLPTLKDHSIAGMSSALKNMYGAIHNPNKYHDDNCDPACAHIYDLAPVHDTTRLTVIDAVRVQCDGGPGFVRTHMYPYGGLIISSDPVAADRVALEILTHLRKLNGRKRLEDAGRPVKYLATAAKLGLGEAELGQIDLKVLHIDPAGDVTEGELKP
jgi:uncharacterized protein (DUF362 family)